MRFGVDFGTTRVVVAAVDRGNYPLVSFETGDGQSCEWYPSLVAVREGKACYGWQAWNLQQDTRATVARSLKRYLAEAGPATAVEVGGESYPMLELLTGMCVDLRAALERGSSLELAADEKLEVMLGAPANANGNQRFLTVEAFRRAGFEVLGLLNEPSAASVEYGHGLTSKAPAKRDLILVYDFGGGTFDVSLVARGADRHDVIATEGVAELGGDDFDEMLAEVALDQAGIGAKERASLSQAEWFRLVEECRVKKEALNPSSRKIQIELDQVKPEWDAVSVPVSEFYDRVEPLIEQTIHAVKDLLRGHEEEIEALYVTGGASELPPVPRALKEHFGRRVRRSAYSRGATAIGLAIRADSAAGYVLRDRFTRNFGVWREAEGGRRMIFDPLFLKGTPLPPEGDAPLKVTRSYYPAHNIGHFRYLECSHTNEDGRPAGEVMIWDEILFPFDPALQSRTDLTAAEVSRAEGAFPGPIEESYECDSGGAVTVTIANRAAGYERAYRLGRWSVRGAPVRPGRKRARKASAASKKN